MKKSLYLELKHRVQLRKPDRTANAEGGFDQAYDVEAIVWAGIKQVSTGRIIDGVYVRGAQTKDFPTHIFTLRRNGELEITQNGLMQSNRYLFWETGDRKGRSFRILSVTDVGERNDRLEVIVKELETHTPADDLF
jgi:head-tail adaptor